MMSTPQDRFTTNGSAIELNDELDIVLRPPAVAAARAIVVSAVCRRAHLELAPGDLGPDDPEGERFDLAAWVVEEGLDPTLTPAEQRLLKTRTGKLPADDVIAASWQIEGVAALAWAMGLLDEIPRYDEPVDPAALLSQLPSPWSSTRPLRSSAGLRPESAIARERERAELWQWRAENAGEGTGSDQREVRELRTLVREVAEEAHVAGLIDPPVGHDFPVRGRPYRDQSTDTLETLAIIAAERLRALNWLCGFGADWESVPLDV
jgi:hypothetical protein